MFENLIPDARIASRRAAYAREVGTKRNVKSISQIVESIEVAVNRGEEFVTVDAKLRDEVIEREFQDKGYSIGPNFKMGDRECFSISWPKD